MDQSAQTGLTGLSRKFLFREGASGPLDDLRRGPDPALDAVFDGLIFSQLSQESANERVTGTVCIDNLKKFRNPYLQFSMNALSVKL